MKNFINYIFLCLCFCFLSHEAKTQTLSESLTSNTGEYNFNLTLPHLQYATFYDFKNGHFSNHVAINQTHAFNSPGSYKVDAYFAERYRPGTLKRSLSAPISITQNNVSTSPALPVRITGNIQINSTWDNAPNEKNFYIITLENNITNPNLDDDGIITVNFPPALQVIDAFNYAGDLTNIGLNSVTWDYVSLPFGEQRNLFIETFVDPSFIQSPTTILNTSVILNSNNSVDVFSTSDNSTISRTPHDPNIMQVSDDCVMYDIDESKTLNYTVNFQNVGKGPATDVLIYIDLPSSQFVDYSTIQKQLSSHNCTWKLNGNILEVIYTDIDLPGTRQVANVVIPTSQTKGFFNFNICTKPNLPAGNIFTSEAEIYFDTQNVVITNLVETEITECTHIAEVCDVDQYQVLDPGLDSQDTNDNSSNNASSITGDSGIDIYPNPVFEELYFEFKPSKIFGPTDIKVYDLQGQLWLHRKILSLGKYNLNVSILPSAVYLYSINSESTIKQGRFVKN